MAKKLWDKGFEVNQLVENFTVGLDREMDLHLAKFDVLGTMAHVKMLETIVLLQKSEVEKLLPELRKIYSLIEEGNFVIEEGIEDVHSQVEYLLTQQLGDIGKKVHSGRSRNDQVLVDVKLFLRNEIKETVQLINELFKTLINQSENYRHVLIPGYTHLQVAMPSSFGLWFGAYAESLCDDLEIFKAAYKIVNQNPLGSAAGYGSSFPLDRQMTTDLLGFESMNYNVVYAQMTRGKTEQTVAYALATVAGTLSKMAMDMCLYNSQNFGFVSFPKEYTTGSSIMPHKKNPDVWEILRGKCNRIKALPNEIAMLLTNLPSGYHRELQLLKEIIIPAIHEVKICMQLAKLMLDQIIINENVIKDKRYELIFSVEEVNRMVIEGVPFRDAYKDVGNEIENGNFVPSYNLNHTHEGSIGNLCNTEIADKFLKAFNAFEFKKYEKAVELLLNKS